MLQMKIAEGIRRHQSALDVAGSISAGSFASEDVAFSREIHHQSHLLFFRVCIEFLVGFD